VNIEFVATIAVITPDQAASSRLYVDALGLPLAGAEGYLHSEQVEGVRSFGVWPLAEAARSCFGEDRWPAGVPVPQVSIEFDVADVASVHAAVNELLASGQELLHPPREEPWGQTVARLLSPEGAIIGISHTPALRG
jgi:catechol 2,3-dioxygenase-like lactoylglutathione lyase family enzyme